jgi:site-specific DNA recombinase
MKEIVSAIEEGGYTRTLTNGRKELEAGQEALQLRLARAPQPLPDIHPNVAEIYRRKVEWLAEALNHPEDRDEAAEAIRGLIERITLTPPPQARPDRRHPPWRPRHHLRLAGPQQQEWQGRKEGENANTPGLAGSGVSVSVVAGVGFEPTTFRL